MTKKEELLGSKTELQLDQVWTEKEYTANAAQISSEQYLLFVGNDTDVT